MLAPRFSVGNPAHKIPAVPWERRRARPQSAQRTGVPMPLRRADGIWNTTDPDPPLSARHETGYPTFGIREMGFHYFDLQMIDFRSPAKRLRASIVFCPTHRGTSMRGPILRRSGASNRQKSTKFVDGFEVDSLIPNELSGKYTPGGYKNHSSSFLAASASGFPPDFAPIAWGFGRRLSAARAILALAR